MCAARSVSDEQSLIAAFEAGKARRAAGNTDLGPAAERSASLFSLTLWQSLPPRSADGPETQLASTLTFADTPGTERLAADPEVLRLREGAALNQGLFALRSLLRSLAGGQPAERADYGGSVLTRLLAEALGGNCRTVARPRGGGRGPGGGAATGIWVWILDLGLSAAPLTRGPYRCSPACALASGSAPTRR